MFKKTICVILALITILSIVAIPVSASSNIYEYSYAGRNFTYFERDIVTLDGCNYTFMRDDLGELKGGIFVDPNGKLITDSNILEKLILIQNVKLAFVDQMDFILIDDLGKEISKAPDIIEAIGDDLVKKTVANAISSNVSGILKILFGDIDGAMEYLDFVATAGVDVVFYVAYLHNLLELIDLCTEYYKTLEAYVNDVYSRIDKKGFTYTEAVQYEIYVRNCIGAMGATVYYLKQLAEGSSYNKPSNGIIDSLEILSDASMNLSDSAFQKSFTMLYGGETIIELLKVCDTGVKAFDAVCNYLAVQDNINYYKNNYNLFSEDYYLNIDDIVKNNTFLETGDSSNGDNSNLNINIFNEKLNEFKKTKYANGSIYVDNPSLTGGYQCFGFANELALYMFGSYPTSSMSATSVNKGWTRTYGGAAIDNLCVGDIVRFAYHSIFITGIDGDTIYYCQANVPAGTNKVTYNNSISRSDLKNKVSQKLTSPNTDKTGWVAHYDASKLGNSNVSYLATDFSATIKDGIYTLKLAHTSGNMLNVYDGTNTWKTNPKVTMWSRDKSTEQQFYFKHESGGKYRIYAVCSGKSGDVYNKVVDVNVGTNETLELGDYFKLWDKSTAWDKCQLFYIIPVGEGKYVIELASMPRAVLAAKNATEAAENGGDVTLRDYKSYTTQQWYFYDKTGEAQVDPSIDASLSNSTYYTGTYKVSESLGLNIRNGAGTSYKKLSAIQNNTKVTVVQVDKNWGKIIHNGITGWICLDYTTYVSPLISSVSVKTAPTKTSYYVGDTLNTAGLTLTVNYSNNTSKTVSEGFTCTPSTLASACKQTVIVDYNGTVTYFDVNVTEKTYSVSYNANGGTSAPATQTKVHGTPLALSTTVPTRTGYTFMGWATSSTATSATYAAGATYSTNENVTLYAVWKANTYTVAYNANGGTGAPSAQAKVHGNNLTLSTTVPTRTGYTFMGWATSSTATSAIYAAGATYSINDHVTLYAIWRANTYTVTYNANGGTNAPVAQTKTHGVTLTLSSAVPTREGYSFWGWATSSTATALSYYPGSSYSENANITLYALWEADKTTYSVTYNANGGTNAPAGQTKTHGVNLSLSYDIPSRKGYTFMGWSTSNTATTATYASGETYSSNANVTLYAVWKANIYTVTYKTNDGTNLPEAQSKTHGVDLTLTSLIPTRAGYTFIGWRDSYTTIIYQPGDTFTENRNTYLYAQWNANTYTITYNANGGTNAPAAQTKTHGVNLTLTTATPIRPDHTFMGWATSSSATSATYAAGATYGNNANVTFYAVWKENVKEPAKIYHVTIDNKTVTVGDTFTLNISFSEKYPVKSVAVFNLSYDSSVFELLEGKWQTEKEYTIGSFDKNKKDGVITFEENTVASDLKLNLTFKAVKTAKTGDYKISCDATVKSMDSNEDEIAFESVVADGVVSVRDYLRGDMDNNGKINSNDAIYLLRFTLIPGQYPLNQNGDVDGNGKVNSNDAIYLLRHTLIPSTYPLK